MRTVNAKNGSRRRTSRRRQCSPPPEECRGRGSNPHGGYPPRDFKSLVSASSTTPACSDVYADGQRQASTCLGSEARASLLAVLRLVRKDGTSLNSPHHLGEVAVFHGRRRGSSRSTRDESASAGRCRGRIPFESARSAGKPRTRIHSARAAPSRAFTRRRLRHSLRADGPEVDGHRSRRRGPLDPPADVVDPGPRFRGPSEGGVTISTRWRTSAVVSAPLPVASPGSRPVN
jgi:hypothetical protein